MLNRAKPDRLLAYLLGGAAVFIILFGVRALASVLNPILLAVVITITVLPLPGWLSKRGVPGWLSLVLTILIVVGTLGLVILTIFFSVSRLTTELPTYLESGVDQVARDLRLLQQNPAFVLERGNSLNSTLSIPAVQSILGIAASMVMQFGLTLLIFFFMLSAAVTLPDAARLGIDPNMDGIGRFQSLTKDVRQYVIILTGINFLVGLGNTILLFLLGVDYALLWGVLSWFMGYIPSVGFLIALVPPLLLGFSQYGLTTAVIILVGYVVINGGIQNFIQPRIMGDGLRLSPVVIFISLFVWAFLLGGFGAILAVPLTLLVVTFMENFEATRNAAALMRYTGRPADTQKPVTQDALRQVRNTWSSLRNSLNTYLGAPENKA